MGEPGCCRRPPSRREPVSIGANPISPISFPTTDFAPGSSPARKMTSRSSPRGRDPVSRVFQPIVLKAFTKRALGIRFATSSLDVSSPRSTGPTDRAVCVHGVNDDLSGEDVSRWERVHPPPWNGEQDRIAELRGPFWGIRMRAASDGGNEGRQRVRTPRVRHRDFVSHPREEHRRRTANVACSDDPDSHVDTFRLRPMKTSLLYGCSGLAFVVR